MIATTRAFMAELSQNNDRDWFEAKKAMFKSDIEGPAKLLTDLFAEDLSRLTGTAHTGKMGRIYRDTRFSKDKSPYNTYIHAYWQQTGGSGPGWLLNIDATGATLMTGLHALDPDGLARYRAHVHRDGDSLAEVIETARDVGAKLIDFGDTALKRVPKPYDPDHPHGNLLRRKQIALGMSLNEGGLSDGLMSAMARTVQVLLPFWLWCDQATN
ncbi:MAG: DUF2461 domain-containing protein [Paracoccaceae bacterium]